MWVLFSDAARVPLRYLRTDAGRCLRLLGVGLPLTVLAGWALAAWLLPGAGGWLALLLGASLALTDAALGTSVVTDPAVPARVRRLITVESGRNDGIVTPESSSRWPAPRRRRGSRRRRARSRRWWSSRSGPGWAQPWVRSAAPREKVVTHRG